MKTKEEIYDEQISPLMAKVIEICKAHQIPVIADFMLDPDEGLKCTTVIFHKDWGVSDEMYQAERLLVGKSNSLMMLTVRDGDGKVTEMKAIL